MSVFEFVFISDGNDFLFAIKNSSRTKLNSAIKLKSVEPKRRSKSTSDIRFIPLVGKNNKFLFLLSWISTDAPNVKKKAKTFNIRSTLHCLFSSSFLGDIMSLRYVDARYCRGHIWPGSLFRLDKLIAIVSPNKHTEVNPVMQLKNPKREFIKFRLRVGTEYEWWTPF